MKLRCLAILCLAFSFLFGAVGSGQDQSAEGSRRIVRKSAPIYPEIAKRMSLAGTVRVTAVVSADGTVKSVEAVGGSPMLIKAAEDAILKWKFAAGAESRELIELHFKPQ